MAIPACSKCAKYHPERTANDAVFELIDKTLRYSDTLCRSCSETFRQTACRAVSDFERLYARIEKGSYF